MNLRPLWRQREPQRELGKPPKRRCVVAQEKLNNEIHINAIPPLSLCCCNWMPASGATTETQITKGAGGTAEGSSRSAGPELRRGTQGDQLHPGELRGHRLQKHAADHGHGGCTKQGR